MKPIIRLYNFPLYLHTALTPQSELPTLKKTLIPSLEFVGLQSQSNSLNQLAQICKSLKIKDPILGSKGMYRRQNGHNIELQYIEMEDIKVVETQVPIIVNYNDKDLDLKTLEMALYSEDQKIQVVIDQTLVTTEQDIHNQIADSDSIQFIIPPLNLSQQADSKYYGAIPIILYLPAKKAVTKQILIDALLIELVGSLKIILKNKLPYRKLQKRGNIQVHDFAKSNEMQKPMQSKLESREIGSASSKGSYKLIGVIISFLVFYLGYRMMM